VKWIRSFLNERATAIRIAEYTSSTERVHTGIPQGSPISPILYLFYNADLLDDCEDIAIAISPIGFVDDINLLTYGTSIQRNCRNLEKAYQKCIQWARTHGSKFNPEKSELIHFIGKKRLKRKDTPVTLEGTTIKPSKTIRVLGTFLNQSLTPKAHLAIIQKRAPGLLLALKALTQSTWGATLKVARELYLRAIRPVFSYGSLAWFPLLKGVKTTNSALQSIQGRFLRVISGAYRATATEALEIETFTEPLDLYIEKTANQSLIRLALQGQGEQITAFSRYLARKTRGRRGRERRIPLLHYEKAIKQQKSQGIRPPRAVTTAITERNTNQNSEWNRYKKALEAYYAIKWRKRWLRGKKGRAIAKYRPYPTEKALKLYEKRVKAVSTALILLRTEKIGLRAFLFSMNVPGYNSPQCECQQQEETVQHFLLECTQWDEQRETLGPYRYRSLKEILETREGSRKAVEFLLQTKRLEQFQAVTLQEEE